MEEKRPTTKEQTWSYEDIMRAKAEAHRKLRLEMIQFVIDEDRKDEERRQREKKAAEEKAKEVERYEAEY